MDNSLSPSPTCGVLSMPCKPSQPTLDMQVLEGLLALPRGAASVQRILRTYLDTTPALLSALQEGFCQGDAMHVEQAAHSLKSSSGNVGALALAELARALEAMGRAQNLAQAAPLLAGIAREYAEVCQALARELSTLAAA